jgi:hypothetical protein
MWKSKWVVSFVWKGTYGPGYAVSFLWKDAKRTVCPLSAEEWLKQDQKSSSNNNNQAKLIIFSLV